DLLARTFHVTRPKGIGSWGRCPTESRRIAMWIRTCVVATGLLAPIPPAFAGDGLGIGETITLSMDGASPSDGQSYSTSISHDGRYVAFMSNATNLSDPAGNGLFHILLRDRKSGTTRIVSVSDGLLANASCDSPALSDNGRYI